jgi:hypothetical protein
MNKNLFKINTKVGINNDICIEKCLGDTIIDIIVDISRACLDSERISARMVSFKLVIENNMMLVIS